MSSIIATTPKPTGNAARVRMRLLAAFLPVTAVLYIGAEALDPRGTDQVVTNTATALRLLPIASAHSSQLYLSGSLSVLALGGLAVSYAAIAKLVTGRGWVIATFAALLGGLGAFAGAMLNVLGGISLAVAASAHVTQAAAAQFLVTSFGSWPAQAAAYIYFASEYLAPVVMGFALWRSRRVGRWLAVLFTVGLEVAESMGAIGPKVVLFMLPFAVAMILLAVKIWQSAARPAAMADPEQAHHADQLAGVLSEEAVAQVVRESSPDADPPGEHASSLGGVGGRAVDVRVPGSQQPFVGRKAELDVLAAAYARASGGHPQIVSVEGPAGIGKTALVRNFLAAASAPVISASGDEAEMTLPWGMVSQLARGAPADCHGPLRQLAELRPGADPLASGRLLLDAVGVLASPGPVVLVVEDLHWIDHPSAQALRFALRRLKEEAVLALVTTRPEGAVRFDDGWRRLFDDRGQRLSLAGLEPPEVAHLVSALGGGTLSELAACRLWRHAGGNPLYTRCLVEELDPAVLAAASGPLAAPRSLATLLVARLAACAPGTRDLVSAAAVLGERCSLALAALIAGVPAPAGALGEAVAARLLTENHDGGVRQVQFPHPLVRAAIYADLSPARRAALHLSAARLTAGAVALSHRVAAAAGPDAGLAAELAEAAAAAAAGGMHAAAAGHLISAADLSAEPALREDRLLAACTLWLRAGAVHEVSSRRALLEGLAPSPRRDHLRGFLAHLEGRPDEARTALRAALGQLQATGGTDPVAAEAAPRLAGLAVFDWDWQAALALVDSVPDTGSRLSLLIRCIALTMAGRTADARRLLDAARQRAKPGRGDVLERLARGFTAAWSDDLSGAKRDLEAIAGRPDGFGGSLRSAAHWLLADVYYRLGAFDDAVIAAELARSLLQDTGREGSPEIAMANAVAAYAASARGDWAGARAGIAAADARAKPAASKFERACAAAARWSVAAALDDPPTMLQAARDFDAAADAPEPSLFPFGPVLAEALWRNRRLEEAASRLAAYEAHARSLGRNSALVGACRVRGLLEADRHDTGAALRAFDEATPIAARLLQPLEAARFAAAHGLVLARLGKRKAAADKTAEARSVLQRIGAQPYLESADRQLARIGGRGQRRSGTGELTASELAVAQLVASGLSNRQAAERLTVSPKAIEFHLANIYAKLQVSSRSQLAARDDFRATLGPASARKS